MTENRYAAIGRQMLEDERNASAATVTFASQSNPANEAEVLSLAKKTGAPVGAVRADMDGAREMVERRQFDALSPTTRRWLGESHDRYALLKDDVGALDKLGLAIGRTVDASKDGGLSSAWTTWTDHFYNWDNVGAKSQGAMVRAAPEPTVVEETVRGIIAGQRRGVGAMAFMAPDMRSEATRRAEAQIAGGLGFESSEEMEAARTAQFIAQQERMAQRVERQSSATDAAFQKFAEANEADSLWDSIGLMWGGRRALPVVIGQSVGQALPGMAATALTGGTSRLATATVAGASSGGTEYGSSIAQSLSEAGVDLTDPTSVARALRNPKLMAEARKKAAARGVSIGLIDAATAGLAGALLVNARRGIVSVAPRVIGEGAIQAGGGAVGETVAQVASGDEIRKGDIMLEAFAELPSGALEVRSNYVTARNRGQVRWLNEQLDIVRRSSEGSEALQAATAAAGEAQIGKRSADIAQAFAREHGADGRIYIDAEAVKTLFQSDDLRTLANAVGGDASLAEQLAAGDVAIPADQYFSTIAQLPNAMEIARHARVQPDAVSAVELESYDFDALADQMVSDTSEAAERAKPGEPTTRERVQQDVYGQLVSTGRYSDAAAMGQAKLWGAFFASMENRYGVSGWDAYSQRLRGIKTATADGKADPRSTRPWMGDGRFDALLDSIRLGDSAPSRKTNGPSLTQFLRKAGGIIDEGGELRGMDAGKLRIGLVNSKGMGLDRAREMAAEAGFFGGDETADIAVTTTADLLDLIDRDLRNGDVFSAKLGDADRQAFQLERDELARAIDDNEYLRALSSEDFRALTNQQVADALFSDGGVGVLEQSAGDDGFSEEGRKQFRETERAYGGREGYEKAKAEGKTKLTYGQWVQVRTPNFKRWFGDWEAVQHRQLLDGKPVSTLTGAEFVSDGVPLTENVPKWYADNGHSTVEVEGIGAVALDVRAVSDSIAHGLGRAKAAAFAAVPDVLSQGQIIHRESMRGSTEGGMTYHVAAPVRMGDKDVVVSVLVKADPRSRRMYVHEVALKERLQQRAFKTGAVAAEAGKQSGANDTAGAIRSVLQRIYEVNPAEVSKVVDPETGEPLVVYHGTNADFDTFTVGDEGDVRGVFLAPDAEQAGKWAQRKTHEIDETGSRNRTGDGENIMPVYVSIQNPAGPGDLRRAQQEIGENWTAAEVTERLVAQGFDGYIDAQNEIVAFRHEQIKSALGNNGNFDPSNPSILESVEYSSNQIKSATANNGDFSEDPNILKQGGEAPRGQLQIFPDKSMAISLFEKADRSTFLHETGHFFLEVLRGIAEDEGAPQQAKDDMAALLKWFGVESADQVAVEHHEQFARGFEQYLGEGKAPSPELQSAFSQFKAWLLSVYKSLVGLNVNLTDDVRGVMDRMLAADEEIEAAQVRQGVAPLVFAEGVLEAGQIQKYAAAVAAATESARAALGAKLMAAHDRAAKRWYKERRAEVLKEVEAEYAAMPVYRAAKVLAGAKKYGDGTPIPDELRGLKLDKAALVAVYGEQYLQRLGKLYAAKGGVDQDAVAVLLGFSSGDALVKALANREDMAARVKAETDTRMVEMHGDPLADGTLSERAMEAVHGQHQMLVLAWEMEVLSALAADPLAMPDSKRPGRDGGSERKPAEVSPETRARIREASAKRTVAARMLTEVARRTISKKTLRDIRPHDYLVAERKAALKAAEAAGAGRYVEALQAKRQQAFNAALYREAKRAQKRTEAHVKALRKAASEKTRSRIGKEAGKFYVDALDAIFAGIEVRGVSRPQVARRDALRDWVRQMQEDGSSTAVPELLLARVESESVTNLADMTVSDVDGLREAVDNLLHLARTKNRLLTEKGAREWGEAKEEMVSRLSAQPIRHGRKGLSEGDRKLWQLIKDGYAAGANWALQPETLIEWLDGGTSGPFHDFLWDMAQQAERKREALNRMVGAKLEEALNKLPDGERKMLDRSFSISSLGDMEVTGHSILSALLNMGNDGNRDKLILGGRVVGDEMVPFTEQQLAEMFSNLTVGQARMVQDMWDAIGQLWPEIVALEESMNGIAPERVQASPFTVITRNGPVTLRGGYYPAMYDPKGAKIGAFAEDEAAKRVISGMTPIRASTSKGYIEARTDFVAPLLLDYSTVLTRHLDGVMGDIAYRQFLRQAYKVLNDADIRRMIDNRVGPGAAKGLRQAFERGVVGSFALAPPVLGPVQGIANATMTNVSSAALGFRIPLAIANVVASPIQAAARVKPKYVLRGLVGYYTSGGPNVIANMRKNAEFIQSVSPLMLRRAEARTVELGSIIASMRGKRGIRAKMIELAMSVHQWVVPLAENAVWMGAYQQAMAGGVDAVASVKAADKAIRQTQTKTSAMELSDVEGGNLRIFMQFAGPLVVMNNRLQEAGLRGLRGDVRSWPQALGVWFAVAMGAAWSFELMMGRGADDEDDDGDVDAYDWAKWATVKLALLPFSAFPILRDAAGYADSGFARGTPLFEAIKTLIDTGDKAADEMFSDDEFDAERMTKLAVKSAGVAYGVPSNQLLKSGEYLMSVSTGAHTPSNPAAEAYYMLQGPPKGED